MEQYIVEKIDDFYVVRDDLFDGGTKRRAFSRIVDNFPEKEFVYAVDYFGHAAYAIGLTALEHGKKVHLFYPSPRRETDIFIKTTSLSNVVFDIIEGVDTQVEVSKYAIEYAEKNGAHFLPIGLDFTEFSLELEKVVKDVQIVAPEIWCMGGSGTLGRALQKAYPDTPVHVVSVGTSNFNGGTNIIHHAPEKLNEDAEIVPPYPSSSHYDAKTWRFVLQNAKPGAFIWNVAS